MLSYPSFQVLPALESSIGPFLYMVSASFDPHIRCQMRCPAPHGNQIERERQMLSLPLLAASHLPETLRQMGSQQLDLLY